MKNFHVSCKKLYAVQVATRHSNLNMHTQLRKSWSKAAMIEKSVKKSAFEYE